MRFLLAGRVRWRTLLPSALITGVFYWGLGEFSKFYFSGTIVSDSKTYGTIGAIFGIMTWFIAIGTVIILGAVAGAVWADRRNQQIREQRVGHGAVYPGPDNSLQRLRKDNRRGQGVDCCLPARDRR